MASPFSGMDPYLENSHSWFDVHHRLITALAISLTPQLLPKYQVLIEKRIYQTTETDSILVGIPDAAMQRPKKNNNNANVAVCSPSTTPPMITEVGQGHLEIREVTTSEVVTAVEVLSPTNKRPGRGRTKYETKRQKIISSSTNLVEIDLLRKWESMPTLNNDIQTHYRILVSRVHQRPKAELYGFNLPDTIPSFPLPLRQEDRETLVNLQDLFTEVYDQSGYGFFIDYTKKPVPPLTEADAKWTNELLLKSRVQTPRAGRKASQ